jgi:RNA polymerase sigma-70 factor (ECF subfamily)
MHSLTEQIRRGDHGAFELFYRMEFLNLVHFSNSYLNDQEKAKDIAQEALMALWEHRGGLQDGKNIRAYVFTIARNKTLDELRVKNAPELEYLEDNSVEEYISRLDLTQLIKNVWGNLPPKIGNTFLLSRSEGLKNREIAQKEGITEKAVEYRMRIALEQFRKNIKKYLG